MEPGWSSLPADLLRDILARLPWSSHPSFAATCKHWNTIVSPFYPAWLTPVLLNAVDIGSTNIRYYSPYYHKIFEVAETLDSPDAKICCANGDHLTLYYRDGHYIIVVHANLATGFIRKLEPLPIRHTLDFVIDDGERSMFGIRAFAGTVEVARSIQRNDDSFNKWESSEFISEGLNFRTSSMTNPVLHHGLLYMLGEDGRLAVYHYML
ncbi:hypothetical protein PR202_gb22734 [Eleusine coracana subsp. coracana]|uniref:F-box domain-containing protein n=1 Tax=Eleusine coracana subsp. coracana TaxID=191504 RepID=A0AAV5FIH9_ELECO|nr:hypothetical protein QOZ80_6AG0534240 [Eleusine coracana subsp. coracana]GJN34095.1 hypothetical protein PR202_gb22734 [Eleusine coracana subsp. coracana]